MACSKGDNPKITYNFNNGANKVYMPSFSPVEIITNDKPIDATSNYNPEGFQITFESPQARLGTIVITVADYMIFFYPGGNQFDSSRGYYIAIMGCGSTSFSKPSSPRGIPYDYNGYNISLRMTTGNIDNINTNIRCPTPNGNKCTIQVFTNGQLLFQDQGNCPVNYSVQCKRCPDGTCECASSVYPGYCCLDCASTAANIRTITNDLRAKNG